MKYSFKENNNKNIVVAKRLGKCQRPKKKCWSELKIVANMGLHINGVKPYNYSTKRLLVTRITD
jgi:hypothetical protein